MTLESDRVIIDKCQVGTVGFDYLRI